MIYKERVIDRLTQSIEIFKNNFKELFIPVFIYQFVLYYVFLAIGIVLFLFIDKTNYFSPSLAAANKCPAPLSEMIPDRR